MPDSFFSKKSNFPEMKDIEAVSRISAFIDIINFTDILEQDDTDRLNEFYHELSQEIYNTRRNHYGLGLSAIEPEVNVMSGRFQLTAPLYLEKDLPELSAMVFKLFVEYCNMLLSVAIKHEIAVKGAGTIGNNYKGNAYSAKTGRSSSKETMVLSDLLEIFTFDEIFPEGFGQKVISPMTIPFFYGRDLSEALRQLESIEQIGIFFPKSIMEYPAAEISVFSEMLIETNVKGELMYSCNWKSWMEKKSDDYSMEEIMDELKSNSQGEGPEAKQWKTFLEKF